MIVTEAAISRGKITPLRRSIVTRKYQLAGPATLYRYPRPFVVLKSIVAPMSVTTRRNNVLRTDVGNLCRSPGQEI